ncbi:MAG: hypothetical protein IPJ20_20795 [Flammeovirgaceae bacterium]|nr:hypothetical protein [Flammeovirgaceae bacterium]
MYLDSTGKKSNYDVLFDPIYAVDYYVDSKGMIVKGLIRKSNEKDKLLLRTITDILESADAPVERVTVDCANVNRILQDAYKVDQNLRSGSYDLIEDRRNQSKVISLIESCGFPLKDNVGEEGITSVFLIIQHSTRLVRQKYYPWLKTILDAKDAALMEDRMLLENGERQKYGTQIIYNSRINKYQLRAVEDVKNLNKRRFEVGLEPIEEYVKIWGIDFHSN